MADDPKHSSHEPEDDITQMMYIIGALLAVSMVIAYFVSF